MPIEQPSAIAPCCRATLPKRIGYSRWQRSSACSTKSATSSQTAPSSSPCHSPISPPCERSSGRCSPLALRRCVRDERIGGCGRQLCRRRQAGDREDLRLVESLLFQQRNDEHVERVAVRAQQPQRLVVTLTDDAPNLGVDRLRRRLAEWPICSERRRAAEIRVRAWRELHEAQLLAHTPARDHVAREPRRLLDVALGSRSEERRVG